MVMRYRRDGPSGLVLWQEGLQTGAHQGIKTLLWTELQKEQLKNKPSEREYEHVGRKLCAQKHV